MTPKRMRTIRNKMVVWEEIATAGNVDPIPAMFATLKELIVAYEEAIAATREEDARIADHYAQSMIGLPGGASPHNAALNIAALIRKAQPTTGGTALKED